MKSILIRVLLASLALSFSALAGPLDYIFTREPAGVGARTEVTVPDGNNLIFATGPTGTATSITPSALKILQSIDNVENTALSAWAGSTNLITAGVLTATSLNGLTVSTGSNTATLTRGTAALTWNTTGTLGSAAFTAAGAYQPANANLTTWAGVTPGTGVATALGVNVGAAGAFVIFNGDLGTPTSGVGTNLTGTAAGLTAGTVTTNANLTGHITSIGNAAVLGSFTLAQLNAAVSDANLARIDAANTFVGIQSMTSPDITTSLTSPSATFALLNVTPTTVNAFGAATTINIGASAATVLNFGGSAAAAEFRFLEPSGSGTNYSGFKAQAQGANITYTLPATIGGAGTILTDVLGNGSLSWTAPAGSGDVTAAAAFATDNRLIRSDGTGKGVQATGITVDDSDNMTGVVGLTATTGSVTTLRILDSVDQSHGLSFVVGSDLTADRNLTITTGDAARVLTISGDITLPAGTALVSGGALGTPSTGTVTNLTGTASININGTVGATTPAAGTFTTAIANSFVPNLSTIPTNGIYLQNTNTLGFGINSAGELKLTATELSPISDGGLSFGTAALGWQNLFANTGFSLDIENGNWTATHSSGTLNISAGTLTIASPGNAANAVLTTNAAQTLTNKTFDASATGNVVKMWGYLQLTHPHVFAAGVTQQTTVTAGLYGQALFGNATDKATNYVEYHFVVPPDIDTGVDLTAVLHFVLGGADTGDHEYELSFDSVAASADKDGTLGDAISLAFTADASGASDDEEQTTETTLTGWRSAMTAGQRMVVRLARDGDHANDTSTANSYTGPLVIKYGITQ